MPGSKNPRRHIQRVNALLHLAYADPQIDRESQLLVMLREAVMRGIGRPIDPMVRANRPTPYERPSNYQLAFYATLLVLNRRSADAKQASKELCASPASAAKQAFEQARSAPSGRSAHPEYVKAYADYYLELIERGTRAERFWQLARALPQTRFSSAYLPLPPTAVP